MKGSGEIPPIFGAAFLRLCWLITAGPQREHTVRMLFRGEYRRFSGRLLRIEDLCLWHEVHATLTKVGIFMDQRSVRMPQNDGRARALDSDKVERVSQMRLLRWNRRQLGDGRSPISNSKLPMMDPTQDWPGEHALSLRTSRGFGASFFSDICLRTSL
jgi:hypothetical protein